MDTTNANSIYFRKWCLENKRSYSYVSGVRLQPTDDVKDYLTPYGYYIMNNWRESPAHFDTMGPIGCFLAHKKAWEYCVQENKPCWIFEEGVVSYDTKAFELFDTTYIDYDFLHGHTVPVVRIWKQKKMVGSSCTNNDMYPIDQIYYGTKCYRVSPTFAKILLDNSIQFDVHVDTFVCLIAMYYADLKTGKTRVPLVVAGSSKLIDHSVERNVLLPQTLFVIIGVLCGCLLFTLFTLYLLYRKCRNQKVD